MPFSDDILKRLTEPPSPELLQRVAQTLYEIEPLRFGDMVVEWDALSDDARRRCSHYAATIIAAWQGEVLAEAADRK